MTTRQMRDSIEPGSTEYGDRQTLEAGLAQLGPSGVTPEGGPAPAAAGMPLPDDPIGALLGGSVSMPPTDGPLTAGLSVGAGPGPMSEALPAEDPRAQKLRMVATQAASPSLRHIARRMLERLKDA